MAGWQEIWVDFKILDALNCLDFTLFNISTISWTTLVVHNRDRPKTSENLNRTHTKWIFKTAFNSFELYKNPAKVSFNCVKYSLGFLKHYWNVFKNFDTVKNPDSPSSYYYYSCYSLLLGYVIILIILVWKGYSRIKTRYIHINYWTIFKMFISSAVAFQKSHFLIHIQGIDLSSFF